jgi:hypothetical protein
MYATLVTNIYHELSGQVAKVKQFVSSQLQHKSYHFLAAAEFRLRLKLIFQDVCGSVFWAVQETGQCKEFKMVIRKNVARKY